MDTMNSSFGGRTSGGTRRRPGEWDVDVGEIMDGVYDEAEEAPPGDGTVRPGEGAPGEGEGFELKHLGETYTVPREKVIELAQKGLDYDRVRAKLEAARDELAEIRSWMSEVSGGKPPEEFREEVTARAVAEREGLDYETALLRVREARAQTGAGRVSGEERAKREVREFFAAHPEAAAALLGGKDAIPDEVWQRVRSGESLSAAWEAVRLRGEARENAERVRALEQKLAETRQAESNRARSTGSMGGSGGDVERDMAAIGWNEV